MATLDDLRGQVRIILGEDSEKFWLDNDLDSIMVESIREVENRSPNRALKELWDKHFYVPTGSTTNVAMPSDWLRTISISCLESDHAYGFPWDEVDNDYLIETRRSEGNLDQDETATRIFALSYLLTTQRFYLYPAVKLNRTICTDYIKKASESGEMTLPTSPNLQQLAVFKTVAVAASRKSRDLEMVKIHLALYEAGMKDVEERYGDA